MKNKENMLDEINTLRAAIASMNTTHNQEIVARDRIIYNLETLKTPRPPAHDLETLQDANDRLSLENSRLGLEITALKQLIDTNGRSLDKKLMLKQMQQDFERSSRSKEIELENTKKELKKLQKEVGQDDESLKRQIIAQVNKQDEIDQLAASRDSIRRKLAEEIRINKSTLKEKDHKLSKQEDSIKKLESSLSSSKEREGSLLEKLKLSESTIKSQKAEISTQSASVKRLSADLSSTESKRKKLSEELRIAQDKIKEQEREISALKETSKKDQKSIKLLINDKTTLETDLFVAQQKGADAEDAWRQNGVLTETVAFLWEEDKRIKLDLEKERSVILNLRSENKELSDEISKLKESLKPKPKKPNIFVRLFQKFKKLFSRKEKKQTKSPDHISVKPKDPAISINPFGELEETTFFTRNQNGVVKSHSESITDSEVDHMINDIDKPFDLREGEAAFDSSGDIVTGLISAGIFSYKRSSEDSLESNSDSESNSSVVAPSF